MSSWTSPATTLYFTVYVKYVSPAWSLVDHHSRKSAPEHILLLKKGGQRTEILFCVHGQTKEDLVKEV
jgi:hypothetical protein